MPQAFDPWGETRKFHDRLLTVSKTSSHAVSNLTSTPNRSSFAARAKQGQERKYLAANPFAVQAVSQSAERGLDRKRSEFFWNVTPANSMTRAWRFTIIQDERRGADQTRLRIFRN